MLDVMDRASRGDESARPRFLEMLEADPEGMTLVAGGDWAWLAEMVAIQRMAGQNLAMTHALGAKLAALRGELAGPGASPVERLLAERVALCWLDVHDWDVRHNAAARVASDGGRGLPEATHEHYQTMRDRAHRRYLQALRSLAHVQRLRLPPLLVNVAGLQQVNVGVDPPASPP
jgi:hypothetical protein